jgi:signal transduction histidine kinase
MSSGGAHTDATAETRMNRAIVACFLAIRAVHLSQGMICVATGARAYRRPRLAAAVLTAAIVESGVLAVQEVAGGGRSRKGTWTDALFGTAALAAIGAATNTEDRTASLNWVMPYTVGGVLGFGLGVDSYAEGMAATGLLAATYAATVRDSLGSGQGKAATALTNITSYPAFFVVAKLVCDLVRSTARRLDDARREAVEQGERLAAERERTRQYRMLHDSALQTLEAIGHGWGTSDDRSRERARRDAAALRRQLQGDNGDAGQLAQGLLGLTAEFGALGLTVELVDAELEGMSAPKTTDALIAATREALANVVKHAEATKATVRAATHDDRVEVTIRDHGRGFDVSSTGEGFGLRESIRSRMAEAGGGSEVRSGIGTGTLVRLWSPR